MTIHFVRALGSLTSDKVLLAERYHPAKERLCTSNSVPLSDLVYDIRETVAPGYLRFAPGAHAIVYDTSDADDGFLRLKEGVCTVAEIGSTKKVFRPGDVLISRLRPYLRQVAYVPMDPENVRPVPHLLCSTEFHVLRSRDGSSVAFLVPFLLSRRVQEVLAVSQEGGHHPRFTAETLVALPVPVALLKQRNGISKAVEKIAGDYVRAVVSLREVGTSIDVSCAR